MAPGQINQEIYRTRHALHFHTLQECISKYSNAQIKEWHYKNAFPNIQMHRSRNATPNIAPTTQCAQDLQSSALQECISKRSNAQIKECNSKHRPNNATPNIAPTTRHRSQLHNPTTRHTSQRALYRTRHTELERRHPPRLEPAARSARCPHTYIQLACIYCTTSLFASSLPFH